VATYSQTSSGSANDATERNANTNFNSTGTLNTVRTITDGTDTCCGSRFTGVTIPRGARIDSAILEFFLEKFDDAAFDNYGEAVDDAVDFASNADVASRSRTSATVAWDSLNLGTGAYKSSPDLKSIIQELVNRAGWVSGNDIVLLQVGRNATAQSLQYRTCDHANAATEAPKLTIDYTLLPGNFFPIIGGP
jgi:hypothetical protein